MVDQVHHVVEEDILLTHSYLFLVSRSIVQHGPSHSSWTLRWPPDIFFFSERSQSVAHLSLLAHSILAHIIALFIPFCSSSGSAGHLQQINYLEASRRLAFQLHWNLHSRIIAIHFLTRSAASSSLHFNILVHFDAANHIFFGKLTFCDAIASSTC